ncbi:MAG: hypothetical protein ACE361_08140 [Aureliella sp.]
MLASLLLLLGLAGTQSGCTNGSFRKKSLACDSLYGAGSSVLASDSTHIAKPSQMASASETGERLYLAVPGVQWPARAPEPAKLVSSSLQDAPSQTNMVTFARASGTRFTLRDFWNSPEGPTVSIIQNRYRPGQPASGGVREAPVEPPDSPNTLGLLRVTEPVDREIPTSSETVLHPHSISISPIAENELRISPVPSQVSFTIGKDPEANVDRGSLLLPDAAEAPLPEID